MPRHAVRPLPEERASLYVGGYAGIRMSVTDPAHEIRLRCERACGAGSVLKMTPKSSFCFVDFTEEGMATRAAAALDGSDLQGRRLVAKVQTVENHKEVQTARRKAAAERKRLHRWSQHRGSSWGSEDGTDAVSSAAPSACGALLWPTKQEQQQQDQRTSSSDPYRLGAVSTKCAASQPLSSAAPPDSLLPTQQQQQPMDALPYALPAPSISEQIQTAARSTPSIHCPPPAAGSAHCPEGPFDVVQVALAQLAPQCGPMPAPQCAVAQYVSQQYVGTMNDLPVAAPAPPLSPGEPSPASLQAMANAYPACPVTPASQVSDPYYYASPEMPPSNYPLENTPMQVDSVQPPDCAASHPHFVQMPLDHEPAATASSGADIGLVRHNPYAVAGPLPPVPLAAPSFMH